MSLVLGHEFSFLDNQRVMRTELIAYKFARKLLELPCIQVRRHKFFSGHDIIADNIGEALDITDVIQIKSQFSSLVSDGEFGI
ncbi:hypothetical protein ES703_53497 [subsurface metagenome]